MDRRNLWRVGARGGSVLTGSFAARPAAATPGTIYVVDPIIGIVSNGAAFGAPTVFTGASWSRPGSVVYVNTSQTLITGTGAKTVAQFVVKGGVLNRHGLDVTVHGRKFTPTASAGITFSMSAQYGTTSVVTSAGGTLTATVSGVDDVLTFGLYGIAASMVRGVRGLHLQHSNTARSAGASGSQVAVNGLVSQLVTIKMQLSANTVGLFYRTTYVEARWR